MIIINKLEFEKGKHISTRLIKTFPNTNRELAEQYLENCLALSPYTQTKYELKEI